MYVCTWNQRLFECTERYIVKNWKIIFLEIRELCRGLSSVSRFAITHRNVCALCMHASRYLMLIYISLTFQKHALHKRRLLINQTSAGGSAAELASKSEWENKLPSEPSRVIINCRQTQKYTLELRKWMYITPRIANSQKLFSRLRLQKKKLLFICISWGVERDFKIAGYLR